MKKQKRNETAAPLREGDKKTRQQSPCLLMLFLLQSIQTAWATKRMRCSVWFWKRKCPPNKNDHIRWLWEDGAQTKWQNFAAIFFNKERKGKERQKIGYENIRRSPARSEQLSSFMQEKDKIKLARIQACSFHPRTGAKTSSHSTNIMHAFIVLNHQPCRVGGWYPQLSRRQATRRDQETKWLTISRTMPKETTTRNKNLGSFLARLTKCQPREFAVPIYNKSMYTNYQHMKKKKKKKKKRHRKCPVAETYGKMVVPQLPTHRTHRKNGMARNIGELFFSSDLIIWHPHTKDARSSSF